MILPIIIALSFIITFYPGRATLSGRLVAAFCGLNCVTFLLVSRDSDLVHLRALQQLASSDHAPLSGHMVTAYLLLGLSAYMAFYGRRHISPANQGRGIAAVPATLAPILMFYATFAGIYVWAALGWDTVWSYRGYGGIKDLQELFRLDPAGKLMASTLNFIVLSLLAMAVFEWHGRRRFIAGFALIPISIGMLLGLASASRITAVYIVTAGACFYLTERKLSAFVCAILAVILLGYSLEARAHDYLGLAYVPDYMLATLSDGTFIIPSIANLSMGLLATSGSIETAIPNAYSLDFKILSIMPTINLIDGFQAVRALNEQRMLWYMPFNAFGEAWAFGLQYYMYLWSVLLLGAYCVNSSLRYGRFWHAVLLGSFLIGLIYCSQYPLRNSIRFFYILILMRYIIAWVSIYGRARSPSIGFRRFSP